MEKSYIAAVLIITIAALIAVVSYLVVKTADFDKKIIRGASLFYLATATVIVSIAWSGVGEHVELEKGMLLLAAGLFFVAGFPRADKEIQESIEEEDALKQ